VNKTHVITLEKLLPLLVYCGKQQLSPFLSKNAKDFSTTLRRPLYKTHKIDVIE